MIQEGGAVHHSPSLDVKLIFNFLLFIFLKNHLAHSSINPSKMEVAPQGCLQVINQKTNNQIN